MTLTEIKELLPHREPFLLLDEIVTVTAAGDALTARYVLREDAPLLAAIYPGHYPGNPVTPGVILCEIVFQAGAVLMAKKMAVAGNDLTARTPVVTRIRDARFKRIARPGETLLIEVKIVEAIGAAYYLDGKISVAAGAGTELVARVSFTCALI
jgi:3-hydroxyacyl-[acyl-carrier-protein] dehydratase